MLMHGCTCDRPNPLSDSCQLFAWVPWCLRQLPSRFRNRKDSGVFSREAFLRASQLTELCTTIKPELSITNIG
jgi:hypothetical protein